MPQTPKTAKPRKKGKRKRGGGGLTANMRRFVDEILVMNPRNASAAYRKLHPKCTPKSAGVLACRLMAKPKIAALIEKHDKHLSDQAGLTVDRIRTELSLLTYSDVSNYIVDETGYLAPAPGVPKEVMRAVSSVKRKTTTWTEKGVAITRHEIEFKLWDKPGTLKTSAQHRGMLTEKIEHTGKDGAPLAPIPTQIRVHLVRPNAA